MGVLLSSYPDIFQQKPPLHSTCQTTGAPTNSPTLQLHSPLFPCVPCTIPTVPFINASTIHTRNPTNKPKKPRLIFSDYKMAIPERINCLADWHSRQNHEYGGKINPRTVVSLCFLCYQHGYLIRRTETGRNSIPGYKYR